jgi:hypothetical protein
MTTYIGNGTVKRGLGSGALGPEQAIHGVVALREMDVG